MEKILDCEIRTNGDDAEGSSSGEKQKHYLVKWKGISHIHCTWSVFPYNLHNCTVLVTVPKKGFDNSKHALFCFPFCKGFLRVSLQKALWFTLG
jgi:Chromo (CHRromatin Organisation MOdifier) domain